jgi:hypothetical protein
VIDRVLGGGDLQGYWLPLTVQVQFDPSLANASLDYTDACRHAQVLPIGTRLEEAMERSLGLVFERINVPGKSTKGTPDGKVDVALGLKELNLFIPRKEDKLFPATVILGVDVSYLDASGQVIYEKKLKGEAKGEVSTDGRSCTVEGLIPIVDRAASLVAEGVNKHLGSAIAIQQVGEAKRGGRPAVGTALRTGEVSPPARQPIPGVLSSSVSPLTFRAMVRDDNRDGQLHNGEMFTVEVEVTNSGSQLATGVYVALAGSPDMVRALGERLTVGDLNPGDTKRVERKGRLDGQVAGSVGELILSLGKEGPLTGLPVPKQFQLSFVPKGEGSAQPGGNDVDHALDDHVLGMPRKVAVVVIGVEAYRDQNFGPVRWASNDAMAMARYVKTVGRAADDHVRVLTNAEASKAGVEMALEQWLPQEAEKDGSVIVVFSGLLTVDPQTGTVFLLPHDADPEVGEHFVSLRRVQTALAKLPVSRAVLILDARLVPFPMSSAQGIPKMPLWNPSRALGPNGKLVQVVSLSDGQTAHSSDRVSHSLLTYAILKGMKGEADFNGDGVVGLRELGDYLQSQVPRFVQEEFREAQDPQVMPPLGLGHGLGDFPMAFLK